MFVNVKPPDHFAAKVFDHFDYIAQTVFGGDPSSNENLRVEITDTGVAHDTPVLILVAPWTLCGLAQPSDGRLATDLRLGHNHYPALENELASVGRYWSVLLVPDVSGYGSQDEARSVARDLFEPFRSAVEKVRLEISEIEDASRRRLLLGQTPIVPTRSTAFGAPDGEGDY
jgi:hypothetical protein